MITPGELERLRAHLAALESMTRILDRVAEDMYDGPEGALSAAVERAYGGLEVMERRARRQLELEESVALRWTR